jgi:hypothetical protein
MTLDFPSVYSPPGRPETEFAPSPKRLGLWQHWRLPALILALTVTFLAQYPMSYDFANFVFYDPGVSLRTDLLIARGYVPTIDFGYNYGLLPLLIGRAFFAVAGRTPAGYLLFMFLTEALIVWGMWRLAARWDWPVIVFLIAAMPHAIIPVYLHLTHPLEAALIIHTIADLSIGRRARALALATACIFIKPVMTFGLGLIVIIWMVVRAVRQHNGWASFTFSLLPASLTGIVCALVTVAYFGFAPLKSTILPLVGAKSYQALDFGLLGNGRTFWWPNLSGATQYAKYYLLTPAGFWVISTLLLLIFGVRTLLEPFRRLTAKHETLVTIAACHFFFLAAFYGWPGSWTYYSYLLVIGIGMGLALFRARPSLVLALTLVALVGHTQTYKNTVNAWRHATRTPETAGLWAHADQRGEWAHVRAIAGEREIYYLNNGCPELLFPRVKGPVSFFLSPAMQTPREIELIQRQLEQAEVVVTFNQGPILDAWYWDEFAKQRADFVDTWQGDHLTVHERKRQ